MNHNDNDETADAKISVKFMSIGKIIIYIIICAEGDEYFFQTSLQAK